MLNLLDPSYDTVDMFFPHLFVKHGYEQWFLAALKYANRELMKAV